MKRIKNLHNPTPKLENYLRKHGNNGTWKRFKRNTAAKEELVNKLIEIQRGLCGYCETKLSNDNYQVEHFIPQSDPKRGQNLSLNCTNLIACCSGGLQPNTKQLSCGQAKADKICTIDPREVPALPSLMRVLPNGEIEPNKANCECMGIDSSKVSEGIEILKLNVKRLQDERRRHWNSLNGDGNKQLSLEMIEKFARTQLLPNDDGNLNRFFTTSRSYFSSVGENILKEDPNVWI